MASKVVLDTVDPHDELFIRYLREAGISMTVLEERGPGGGCPVVEYEGSGRALGRLIVDWFSPFAEVTK